MYITNRMKRTNLLSEFHLSFIDIRPSRRRFDECSCGPNTDQSTDFGAFPKSDVADIPSLKFDVAESVSHAKLSETVDPQLNHSEMLVVPSWFASQLNIHLYPRHGWVYCGTPNMDPPVRDCPGGLDCGS